MEQNVSRTFQEYDRTEREIFTAFTNAIRDSHEKQRAQMEYTRYFGLILGITGSFLTFMYSTLKKHDLKNFIEKHLQTVNVTSDIEKSVLDYIKESSNDTKTEIRNVGEQINKLIELSDKTPLEITNFRSEYDSSFTTGENEKMENILIIGGIFLLLYFVLSR